MIPYELSFLFAVLGVVYTNLLTEPGMIFGGVYKYLNFVVFKNDKRPDYHWLFKLIIHCEKCFTGQLSLWFYLFKIQPKGWGYLFMFCFVAMSILMAHLLSQTLKLITKKTEA